MDLSYLKMGNALVWPMIRSVQRLCMILTLGCWAYVIFFLLYKNQDNPMIDNSSAVSTKGVGLVSPLPALDLKSYPMQALQARDIFSPAAVGSFGAVENTPKGQLPEHLKIVGILISNPSQIIIEDSSAHKTYFIEEGNSQAGIKIVRVSPKRVVINYQGQDIPVPINRD